MQIVNSKGQHHGKNDTTWEAEDVEPMATTATIAFCKTSIWCGIDF